MFDWLAKLKNDFVVAFIEDNRWKYIVEGISELCYFLLGIIILIFGLVKTNKYFKVKERIDWRCIFPFGLLIAAVTILCSTEFSDMLVNLINPEWKALEYIIDTAKGMVK